MKKGFSLVELLIVISIAALMATVVVPSLSRARAVGRDSKRKADIESIRSALEIYRGDQSPPRYPVVNASNQATGLVGSYINSWPTDPASGGFYRYVAVPSGCNNTTTNCTSYALCAKVETESPSPAPSICVGAASSCGLGTMAGGNTCNYEMRDP